MNLSQASDSEILLKLKEIVLANLENEHFGVDELVERSGIGVNMLRHRLKMLTHKTIHQYIHEIRLNKAAELLRGNSLAVSEVAWKTGFGSPEYFIRCYHDFFGYSPGEERKRGLQTNNSGDFQNNNSGNSESVRVTAVKRHLIKGTLITVLVIVPFGIFGYLGYTFLILPDLNRKPENLKISIAILPFENDSPDSNNVYFFNRLADMISENLTRNGNFAVTPRRAVEGYRNIRFKTSRQIAKELRVDYLVDGGGQKIGKNVSLTIHLIDTHIDKYALSLPLKDYNEDEWLLCTSLADKISVQIIEKVVCKPNLKVIEINSGQKHSSRNSPGKNNIH